MLPWFTNYEDGHRIASWQPVSRRTGRFVLNGDADITGNGSPAPFSKGGTILSALQVCITGGTDVQFSNITLVLGAPATGHFGTQAIHGVVREPKRSDQDGHRDDH